MMLELNDAHYAAGVYNDFFSDINRIDEYMRKIKMERIQSLPSSLPGLGPEFDLFDSFDMHPNDMEFDVVIIDSKRFATYLEITSSHVNEMSIPGKCILLGVFERNTKKLIGMIRLGSPTINSKPRNQFLGQVLDTHSKEVMSRFNSSAIMGFVIVPTQPFGFNYLGGKLLASICCSHYVREMINEKYGSNICMFETTSLYGTTKVGSQYDGMKPFLRYVGLTDSNFAPGLNDDRYRSLYNWFVEKNSGIHLISPDATSKKLKRNTSMISIIKKSLKEKDNDAYQKFCNTMISATKLTEKKRTYFCTYGYDKTSVADYLNMKTDTIVKMDNYDRFSLEGVTEWWKKKATTRYESLKRDNRLRTVVETWNTNATDIDIIR
jgi:hypothetical protein